MSHSEAQIEQYLRPVVEALCQGLGADLTALALSGSRARGDATSESDWDVLLVARDLPMRPLQHHFHLKALLPEHWRARVSFYTGENATRVRSALALALAGHHPGCRRVVRPSGLPSDAPRRHPTCHRAFEPAARTPRARPDLARGTHALVAAVGGVAMSVPSEAEYCLHSTERVNP